MKHILLTGATGFLGSHLLEALLMHGYKVTILKRSTSNTWRIEHLLEKVCSYDIDVVSVEDAFKVKQVDVVVHTACSYGRQGQSAFEIASTNMMFGLKVLDAACMFNTTTFINTDTLLPKYINEYSLSKNHFTEWLNHRRQVINVVNLRLEHMYGPKDDKSKFVPWLIGQFEADVARVSLTEGKQLRDFIYIDDVVSAYMLILNKIENFSEYSEFDVGTGVLTRVCDFVSHIYEQYQNFNPLAKSKLGFGDIPMREGELMSIKVDNSGLKKMGWNIATEQTDALNKILKALK